MIVLLDDISSAMYKKLKADGDALSIIDKRVKHLELKIVHATEEWLFLEKLDMEDDAHAVYHGKVKMEHELYQLRVQATSLQTKVSKNVTTQTRGFRRSTSKNDG